MAEREQNGRLGDSLFLLEAAALSYDDTETRDGLRAVNALAVRYCGVDRLDEAAAQLERTVVACRQVLGPSDADTLIVEGNLAAAYAWLGRWGDALPLLRANLATRANVVGKEHPATLTAGDALAVACRLAGQHAEALNLHPRVTAQRVTQLGLGHPDSLISQLGLAILRAETGDPAAALSILSRALDEAEGGDELVVVVIQANLAACLVDLGRAEAAHALLTATLARCAALLGDNHTDTAAIRNDLARLDGASSS